METLSEIEPPPTQVNYHLSEDKFQNVEERIKYLEDHKLSSQKLIEEDIKTQNRGMSQKLFYFRILKTLDADIVHDEITESLKSDMLYCFESQRFQANYKH